MGGDNRQLAHYDGSAWKKIATGTTLSIQDIFGAKNPQTGAWEVLAVAGDQLHSLAREVLRVEGLTATAIPDRPLDRPVNTVWFLPGERYSVVGAGLYQKASLADSLWQGGLFDVTQFLLEHIRGTAANDVYAVGHFGEVLHWNGKSWRSDQNEVGIPGGIHRGDEIPKRHSKKSIASIPDMHYIWCISGIKYELAPIQDQDA